MAEHEAKKKQDCEATKRQIKVQTVYDQLKEGAEPEDSQAGQAEVMLRLQQTHGNRYVQRLAEGNRETTLDEDIIRRIEARRGSGRPLEPRVRSQMEQAFGHDFGTVSVHADVDADALAKELGAKAFTVGKDIFFREGSHYSASLNGNRLLVHELAHVVQQSEATSTSPTRITSPSEPAETEAKIVAQESIGGRKIALMQRPEMTEVVARTDGGSETEIAEVQAPPGLRLFEPPLSLTSPSELLEAWRWATLRVAPANAVSRGDQVTLMIIVTPPSGITFRITSWRFISVGGDRVNRPASDADFQTQWQGPLVLPGRVVVDYSFQGTSGLKFKGRLEQILEVSARAGPPWASTVNQQGEIDYDGPPIPPKRFKHLGVHEASIIPPEPHPVAISDGPNKRFRYVESLTPGTYTSQPKIHPDLRNTGSEFYQFHLRGSLLYVVHGNQRTLVPINEYSGFTIAGNNVTFDVPNWEQFYKTYDVLWVRASHNGHTINCQDDWWRLDSNVQGAAVDITNDAAVRNALGIGPGDQYSFNSNQQKQYIGYKLINSLDLALQTRRHEYTGAVLSHRANFLAIIRALDPERRLKEMVSTPSHALNFTKEVKDRQKQIKLASESHAIVDEAASRAQGSFIALGGVAMPGVNQDEQGNLLGDVWDIKHDHPFPPS